MKKYPFRFITITDTAGLIEVVRNGETERYTLPMSVLEGMPDLTDEQIDTGIPYGLPFAEFLKQPGDIVPSIEIALHNNGIWTLQDLRTQAQSVMSALQSVYRIELGKLVLAAEVYSSQTHEPNQAPVDEPITRQKKTIKKEKIS
jgi:hypothetical protein